MEKEPTKKKVGIPDASIFIPVYNEEKILQKNILKVKNKMSEFYDNFEIIIVDDGSTDSTSRIAKHLSNKNVRYVRFDNGPSRRENLAVAMKNSRKSVVVFMDADLATDLKHLEKLLDETNKYDIVIGSRYSGISAKRSLFRRAISVIYNLFLKTVFGSKIKDHQCGFKAFRRDRFIELAEEAGYDDKFTRGWSWDAEILIRAQKKGLKIKEFPVEWISGKDSSFSLNREIKIAFYLIKLRTKI